MLNKPFVIHVAIASAGELSVMEDNALAQSFYETYGMFRHTGPSAELAQAGGSTADEFPEDIEKIS